MRTLPANQDLAWWLPKHAFKLPKSLKRVHCTDIKLHSSQERVPLPIGAAYELEHRQVSDGLDEQVDKDLMWLTAPKRFKGTMQWFD